MPHPSSDFPILESNPSKEDGPWLRPYEQGILIATPLIIGLILAVFYGWIPLQKEEPDFSGFREIQPAHQTLPDMGDVTTLPDEEPERF